MARILISNPVIQHSHKLAEALAEGGHDVVLWTAAPIINRAVNHTPFVQRLLPHKLKMRIKTVEANSIRLISSIWAKVLILAIAKLFSGDRELGLRHLVYHLFDKTVASRVSAIKPDLVIGYEDFCSATFKEAKSLGIPCVLDAPTFHYKAADYILNRQNTPIRRKINKQKEIELEFADKVVACSALARETYITGGVSKEKTTHLILGADLPSTSTLSADTRLCQPICFVFAGVLSKRKSIDLIAKAFTSISEKGYRYQLRFAGGALREDGTDWRRVVAAIPSSEYLGPLSQQALSRLMATSDCLLLPSRYDAFGMVVAESLANGTPAIVTNSTGSSEIFQSFPKAGWVISPSSQALEEQVIQLLENENLLLEAKLFTRDAALCFTWQAYKARALALINLTLSEQTFCGNNSKMIAELSTPT